MLVDRIGSLMAAVLVLLFAEAVAAQWVDHSYTDKITDAVEHRIVVEDARNIFVTRRFGLYCTPPKSEGARATGGYYMNFGGDVATGAHTVLIRIDKGQVHEFDLEGSIPMGMNRGLEENQSTGFWMDGDYYGRKYGEDAMFAVIKEIAGGKEMTVRVKTERGNIDITSNIEGFEPAFVRVMTACDPSSVTK